MTDGAEESTGNVAGTSQDSQGSLREFLNGLLRNCDDDGDTPRFGMLDDTLLLNLSQAIDVVPVEIPESYNPIHSQLQVKCEPQAEETSPDSGYSITQPPSNEADRASPGDPTHQYSLLPISARTAQTQMYEIAPQPIIRNPARASYLGDYDFRIFFEQRESVPKNINYTHSYLLNKLFVKMDVPCPVQFYCGRNPPPGAIIRAMLIFLNEDQVCETVCRCHNHLVINESRPNLAQHVIQTVAPGGVSDQSYYDSSNGRYSVLVPFPLSRPEEENFIILYKFMCFSTCVGGMNRRPVLAVFTLEDGNGNTLGRARVEVKVCSCPGRDRPRDEERGKKRSNSLPVPIALPKKRACVQSSQNVISSYKFLRVKNENYEIVSRVNDALNLAGTVSEEQRTHYQQEQHRDKWTELLAKFCKDNFL